MLEEAEIHAERDDRRKEHIQIGIRAESMIASARVVIEEALEILDRFQIDEMERAILKVKKALAQGKIEKIKLDTGELRKLIEVIYNEIKEKKKNRALPKNLKRDVIKRAFLSH